MQNATEYLRLFEHIGNIAIIKKDKNLGFSFCIIAKMIIFAF